MQRSPSGTKSRGPIARKVVGYFSRRLVPEKYRTSGFERAENYALHAKTFRVGRATISNPYTFNVAFRSADRAARYAQKVFHSQLFKAQFKLLPAAVQRGVLEEYTRILKTAASMRRLQKRDLYQHHQTPHVLDKRAFTSRLRKALRNAKKGPFSVSMIDLDDFKQINTLFGHGAGNLVLDAFSQNLSNLAKRYGGFAGRVGGEEFQLYLPVSPEAQRKILNSFRRSFERLTMTSHFSTEIRKVAFSDAPAWRQMVSFTAGLTGEPEAFPYEISSTELFSTLDRALNVGKSKSGKANTFYLLRRA